MRDGTPYHHVCGPIPNPAYNLDPAKGALVTEDTIERHNKRDENPTRVAGLDAEGKGYFLLDPNDSTARVLHPGPVPIKSEGAGRTAA
jgi:hypothetical protein